MVVVICLQACGEPPDIAEVADCSPVLARVGDIRLCAADVELLAEQAAGLRRELGLEADGTGRLDLAVEFLALVQLGSVADAGKGPLVRGYLDRMLKEAEARPVTDAELGRAHRDEIKKYLTSGESDIFQPTLIDAAAIVVGCFPDGHPPADDEQPVLTMQQARELAEEIAAACGERVADLDVFLAVARRFMRGNPTVDVLDYSRVYQDARLARTPHPLHRVITSLEGNGAVAAPLEAPGAYLVVRRGVTYPGKGEDPKEIREELSRRALLSRKQAAFSRRLNQLRERYQVRTWPERLRGPE
jgi:hypothetical protein